MWILVIQEKVAMLGRALSSRRRDIPVSVDNIDDITRSEAGVVSIGHIVCKLVQRHGVQSLSLAKRDRASGILWTRSVRCRISGSACGWATIDMPAQPPPVTGDLRSLRARPSRHTWTAARRVERLRATRRRRTW